MKQLEYFLPIGTAKAVDSKAFDEFKSLAINRFGDFMRMNLALRT